MRKVFLDDLPRKEGIGANKDKDVIDWDASIGCKVNFVYHNVEGEFEIINYEKKKQRLYLKYNDEEYGINSSGLIKGKIGVLLVKYDSYKVENFEIHNILKMNGIGIVWDDIKNGEILKTYHNKYGYNEFEFLNYKKDERRLYLKYNGEECDILRSGFCKGLIGVILTKYDSYKTDNFEIYNKLKMNEVGIMWGDIKSGEILKTCHRRYGYNEFEFLSYEKEENKVRLKYNGEEFDILTGSFMNGSIGRIIGKITNKFKCEIGTRLKDCNRDLTITDMEYRQKQSKPDKKGRVYLIDMKWYKYKCNKCTWEQGEIEESNLIGANQGCSCCHGQTLVPGINDIRTTASFMIDLGVSEEDSVKYTKSSGSKITVTCPDCGRKKRISIHGLYTKRSIGCICGDGRSYLSKYIQSVLDILDIKYEVEVKYSWNKYINPLNNKPAQAYIDFVIHKDNREIPLEADGGFHRTDNKMTGLTKEMAQNIDKQRDDVCLKYLREDTIRISDEGDVKSNILNSKLSSLFDLGVVDWDKCEEYAIKSNKVKEVCEFWNSREKHRTTKDLEKVFNLNKGTIINYLKKGNRLGWSFYDPKEEVKKAAAQNGRSTRKKVEMFKQGKSLGIFESCHKLDALSEEMFGVKLFFPNISSVCSKKLPHYKGFTFKYID